MRLVVDHDDVLFRAQLATHAAHHLVGGFGKGARLAPGQNRLGQFAGRDLLAQCEGVKVGNENFGLAQSRHLVSGQDVALAVVVLRIVRQEHPQPITDGNAGGDDEKGVAETGILRICGLVQRVPGNEHGHDDGLAGTGRHLQRDARQAGVGLIVGLAQRILDPGVAGPARDLGEVDDGFQRLDLAEKELLFAVGVCPVGQQPGGRGRDARIAPLPPQGDAAADVVDELIFLNALLNPFGIKRELPALFPRPGDRHEV